MATLTNHYLRMLRLDDPDVRGEKAAAEVLGIKGSTFPAKKALTGAERLGSDRLAEVVELLARADLDLHGARAWPPDVVVEVLVARLAGRTRAASRR
jgi:DNA polymerase-3 subunit delta